MGVQRFVQPDYSDADQSGSGYPIGIDRAISVLRRFGAWFAPHEVVTGSPQPDLAVELDAGFIWDGTSLTEVAAQTVTGFTIPSAGEHRIDRVVVDAVTGVASLVAGTAVTGSPSAVAPDIPDGKIPVCQVLIDDGDTAVLNDMITDERVFGASSGGITLGTENTTTGGTSIDFTGIPAGAKRVTIMFDGVSTNGNDAWLVQIGSSGGVESTGYQSSGSVIDTAVVTSTSTAGFILRTSQAARLAGGAVTLDLQELSTNTWVARHNLNDQTASAATFVGSGRKALSGTLDRVRITTTGGTQTFDVTAINVSYES